LAADRAAIEPLFKRVEDEIKLEIEQIELLTRKKTAMEAEQQKDMAVLSAIREDLDTTHLILREQHERELAKIKNEPARINKTREKFDTVWKKMIEENRRLQESLKL